MMQPLISFIAYCYDGFFVEPEHSTRAAVMKFARDNNVKPEQAILMILDEFLFEDEIEVINKEREDALP